MVLSELAKQLKPYILRWIDGVGAGFVRLAGSSGGQTVYGGTAANEDMTLEGTSHATKATSYIILQPTSGYVGIGTTGPGYKLDIVTSVSTDGIRLTRSGERFLVKGDGTATWNGVTASSSGTLTWDTNEAIIRAGTGAALSLQTNGSGTDRLFIDTAGNVGIGTTGPTAKLESDQSSTTAAIPALKLHQDDVSEGFIDFIGTSAASAAGPISTWTVATIAGYVRCEINGAAYWMPYYNAPTS